MIIVFVCIVGSRHSGEPESESPMGLTMTRCVVACGYRKAKRLGDPHYLIVERPLQEAPRMGIRNVFQIDGDRTPVRGRGRRW